MNNLSPMEHAQDAAQQLTDPEFKRFRTWIALDEQTRRERESAAKAGQLILFRQLREAGVIDTPRPEDPWEEPDGASRVYMQHDVITHYGHMWQSMWDGLNDETPGEGQKWVNITPMEPEDTPDM